MSKFKMGDKVICADVSGYDFDLIANKIYTISGWKKGKVFLKETDTKNDRSEWKIERFKLATSEIIKERLKIK